MHNAISSRLTSFFAFALIQNKREFKIMVIALRHKEARVLKLIIELLGTEKTNHLTSPQSSG